VDRRLRNVRIVLGAALLGLVLHLLFGENPWQDGVARRLRMGQEPLNVDYAETYRWWIALVDAVVVAGLLATARRWLGARDVSPWDALAPPAGGRRLVVLASAVAVLASCATTVPRLGYSFWDDERDTLRRAVDGYYRQDGGELVFREVDWDQTWLYTLSRPNNHVPFSILARISLATWRALADPPLRFANEVAVRFPAWVFGTLAIPALALALWRLGFGGAGVLAAGLLALHPWHLRYASEARGYSLLLLCIPLLLWTATRVLHRGSWPRWLALGAVQVVLLWVYPGGGFILGVLGVGMALTLLFAPEPRVQIPRFVVTSLLAGGLWWLLMGPNLLMLLWHIPFDHDPFGMGFVVQILAHLWVGNAWFFRHAPEQYAELRDVAAASPLLFRVALWGSVAALAAGAVRLAMRAAAGPVLLAVLALPAPLTLGYAHLTGTTTHEWYVVFAVPSVVILFALGVDALRLAVSEPRARRALAALGLAAVLGGYAWFSHGVRASLRANPIQPEREAVLLTRPHLDPFSEENRRITTASFARIPGYYDPRVRWVGEPRQLRKLMRRADAENTPLFVNYGRPSLASARFPALVALVEDERLFEPVAELWGFEPRGMMRVYRYRGRD
jgi:hypothetical protein